MPMSKAQADYAIARVKELANARRAKVNAEHTTPAVTLSIREKMALVTSRTISVKDGLTDITYARWQDLFDFTPYEFEEFTTPEGQALLDNIDTELTNTIDKIMLSDAAEALKLLEEFSNG